MSNASSSAMSQFGDMAVPPGGRKIPEEQPAAKIRQELGSLLTREEFVDADVVKRALRILEKINDGSTLFSVLAKLGKITESEFLECVRKCQPDLPVGALLIEIGLVNQAQLKQALRIQEEGKFKRKIGQVLISRRMIRERDITKVLASQLGFKYEEPEIGDCEKAVLETVMIKTCRSLSYLPVRADGLHTVVAFVDPMNQEARTEAARSVGTPIIPVMASDTTINTALSALQRSREPKSQVDSRTMDANTATGRVNEILHSALLVSASDIHIEPLRERVRVRFRVDGILREHCEFPEEELSALVSRLKIMAEADIVERRRHQDGRIEFEDPTTGAISDLRVSFYVTVNGECVVLRVLNQNSKILELDKLGMSPPILERYKTHALDAPSGVIVITGPTGSGKTNTLYSCVQHLNNESTSIITAEDPVEFQIDGISQCSVNMKIGRSFDESIKAVVRQDPDIIVLGEIRDSGSADSAIQAALTGHKVLTTFHTEDCVGGLLRLINMDIEPFLISSTVVCMVAQRLLRRNCTKCSRKINPDPLELQLVGWTQKDVDGANFHAGDGCSECQFTGYRGRLAVFETLILSEPVRDAILERRTSEQIRRICLESAGLIMLLEDGLVKAARGETTLSEVRRTLPRLNKPRSLSELRRLTGI